MKVVLFKESYSLSITRELMYLLVTKDFHYLKKQKYNDTIEHKIEFYDKNNKPINKYKDIVFSKYPTCCLKENMVYIYMEHIPLDKNYQKELVKFRTHPILVDCVLNYEKYTGKKLKDITTIDIPDGIEFEIYQPDYPSDEYIVEKSRRWNYNGKSF